MFVVVSIFHFGSEDIKSDVSREVCWLRNACYWSLKAVRTLESMHEAQLLNYLRATDIEVGLLLNFGVKPEFKRLVYDNSRKVAR